MDAPYLALFPELRRDYQYGKRCAALIAYAVLPSALVSLGAVKADRVSLPSTGELYLVIALLLIGLVPLGICFALVRSRMSAYYLIRAHETCRAVMFTVTILVGSTMISGATGIIQGRYVLTLAAGEAEVGPLLESMLAGVATLAVSSTLFVTVLTKDTELPGLPDQRFVNGTAALKSTLQSICDPTQSPWSGWGDNRHYHQDVVRTRESIDQAIRGARELAAISSTAVGTSEFLQAVIADLHRLKRALVQICDQLSWNRYFASTYDKPLDSTDQELRDAVVRMRETRWG